MVNINFDDTWMTVPYLDIMLFMWMLFSLIYGFAPVAYFTKEVNPRLANHPLETNRRLANLELTSLVKDATDVQTDVLQHWHSGDNSYEDILMCLDMVFTLQHFRFICCPWN